MFVKRLRVAGFFAGLSANHEALTLTVRVANLPWTLVFLLVRKLLQLLHLGARSPSVVATHRATPLPDSVTAVEWYHTIDLGGGVVTPGVFDHRPLLASYRLPDRMDGLRVLDVATWDGFWAFEFERRGAKEVVALDIPSHGDVDLSPAVRRQRMAVEGGEMLRRKTGRGFEIARERLGSSVVRRTLSVYDLSPEAVGTFDVVHVGDLLLHLKYPLRALERTLSVTSGYAIISEAYVPELDALGKERLARYLGGEKDATWWEFSLDVLQRMILDAGFERIELVNTFPFGGLFNHAVIRSFPA
jgi:tRNA (mo5U34)-methyltransferase